MLILKDFCKKFFQFKKELQEDPKTMDYNAGYDVSYEGYNYEDGTIQTNIDKEAPNWLERWINAWPERYMGVVVRTEDGKPIAMVHAKYNQKLDSYEIAMIIKGEERGKGYATEVVRLLCQKLEALGVKRFYHELPTVRKAGIKADLNNGFKIVKEGIEGIKKFGQVEYVTYLEKNL